MAPIAAVGAAVARVLPMIASTAGRVASTAASSAGRAASSGVARMGGGEGLQNMAGKMAEKGTTNLIKSAGNRGNNGGPRQSEFLEGATQGPDVFTHSYG